MRTNIEIDDELMRLAMESTGARTKRAAVEAALRRLVALRTEEARRLEHLRHSRGIVSGSGAENCLDAWLAKGWK